MKPNYLIESNDFYAIQKEIEEIIDHHQISDIEINTYDLEETEFNHALEDLDTYNFLTPHKVILIKNIECLDLEKEKENIAHLFQYIKDPNTDNILIITAKKLDERKKITKELKSHLQYKKLAPNAKGLIQEELKEYQYRPEVAQLLEQYCKDDMTKLHQECEKLKAYRSDTKEIQLEDVKELVVEKLEDEAKPPYDFVTNLCQKKKKEALEQYQEIRKYHTEPISLIGLLASQFRLLYQVKVLEERGYHKEEMAQILKEKPYRIMKTQELTYYYEKKDLLHIIITLADMDLKIKTSEINADHLLELFILNL